MKTYYNIEAVAYDKDGNRLSGNTHNNIEASSLAEAERIAASRQKSNIATARVETKLLYKYEK
jgi:hypothetical protein